MARIRSLTATLHWRALVHGKFVADILEGASGLLQAAAFMIALTGLAPLGLVIGGMTSSSRAAPSARRDSGGRHRRTQGIFPAPGEAVES